MMGGDSPRMLSNVKHMLENGTLLHLGVIVGNGVLIVDGDNGRAW